MNLWEQREREVRGDFQRSNRDQNSLSVVDPREHELGDGITLHLYLQR